MIVNIQTRSKSINSFMHKSGRAQSFASIKSSAHTRSFAQALFSRNAVHSSESLKICVARISLSIKGREYKHGLILHTALHVWRKAEATKRGSYHAETEKPASRNQKNPKIQRAKNQACKVESSKPNARNMRRNLNPPSRHAKPYARSRTHKTECTKSNAQCAKTNARRRTLETNCANSSTKGTTRGADHAKLTAPRRPCKCEGKKP